MHRPFTILEEWVSQGRIRVSDQPVQHRIGHDSYRESDGSSQDPSSHERVQSDSDLFDAAMRDVRRIRRNRGPQRLPERPIAIQSSSDEEDALQALEEVCRSGRIGPEQTREYVEHSAHPAGRLYLNDLRSGRFAIQAHLDLHGLTVAQARPIVEGFLEASVRSGYGCVRVVHGRGLHSRDREPLMKRKVEEWFSYRRLARYIVAYSSARTVDGGGGAVYVLLRAGL